MQGFAMNLRRALFADKRVRRRWCWPLTLTGPTASCFTASTPAATVIFSNSEWLARACPAPTSWPLLNP